MLGKTQAAEPEYGCNAAAAALLLLHYCLSGIPYAVTLDKVVIGVWLDITLNTSCSAKLGLLRPPGCRC